MDNIDELKDLWRNGEDSNSNLATDITKIIKEDSTSFEVKIERMVIFGMSISAICCSAILSKLLISEFKASTLVPFLVVGLTLISFNTLRRNLANFNEISNCTNLSESIKSKLKLFEKKIPLILHIIGLNTAVIGYTVGLWMGNFDKQLSTQKILIFTTAYIFFYLISYFIMKITHQQVYYQLMRADYNLEDKSTDGIDKQIRKSKLINRIVLRFVVLTLILGVVVNIIYSI